MNGPMDGGHRIFYVILNSAVGKGKQIGLLQKHKKESALQKRVFDNKK